MLEIIVAFLVKSTAVLVLTLLVCSARRLSAAERHAIAGTGLAAVAALAVLTCLTEYVRVPGLAVSLPAQAVDFVPFEAVSPASDAVPLRHIGGVTRGTTPETSAATIHGWAWVLGAYVAVAGILGGSTLLGRRRVARYVRQLPSTRPPGKFPDSIDVRFDAAGTPWTWGHRRPFIVLPTEFQTWPRDHQDAVLAHELSHIRRRDCLTDALSRWLCNLFWFQPLAWVVWLRQRRYAEEACDDAALEDGAEPFDYADLLLAITRTNLRAQPMGLAVGGNGLRTRLRSILHRRTCRRRMTLPKRGIFSVLALAVVLPVGSCSLTQSGTADMRATDPEHEIYVFSLEEGLTAEDAEAVASLSNVSRAALTYTRRLHVHHEDARVEAVAIAQDHQFPRAETSGRAVWPLEQGDYLTLRDGNRGELVAVIGGPVRDKLFGTGAIAIGEEIQIGGEVLKVTGVLAPHPPFVGVDLPSPDEAATALSTRLYVPYRSGSNLFFQDTSPSMIRVAVRDQRRLEQTFVDVRELLEERHGGGLVLEALEVPTPPLSWPATHGG